MLTAHVRYNQHRARIFREVGAHMFTVGVEHDGVTALATIERKVATEKGDANRSVINFSALGYDEPASWVGVWP
jgi:hypothetical protein